jgi:hypothetical protein
MTPPVAVSPTGLCPVTAPEARGIRIADALSDDGPCIRVHDGTHLLAGSVEGDPSWRRDPPSDDIRHESVRADHTENL